MKKILIALLAFTSATSVIGQKKIADVATLNTETYDFGKVKQNNPPTATFVITNISSEPLIIETATPTCGCTISDYTKSPIAPGKTGVIKATYNAANLGAIHKTLTVKFAGIDELKSINLAGEVLEPVAYDNWIVTNKTTIKVKDDGEKVKTETRNETGTVKEVKKTTKQKTVVKS
ncbi:MAG: DUF1573 domain-containing protein [Ginsengibacter sp.]